MNNISTFYIKNNQIKDDVIKIIGDDVNHIKNVLRYKNGDELQVCDETGTRYITKINAFENDEVILKICEITNVSTELDVKITLVQGLPKSDKMDFIIQKCTELGVSEIIPVITERTIVKIDEKNENKKLERWQRIGVEAAKQSRRQVIPQVEKIVNLENFVENLSKYDIVIVPYECEDEYTLKMALNETKHNVKNIAIVIGPEGGFSEKDIEILRTYSNVKEVSLGKRILRTETAGIATLSMLVYEFEL